MKIAVTGGTGFIGNHIVKKLLGDGHEVVVTGTNLQQARYFEWFNSIKFVEFNIYNYVDSQLEDIEKCNKLIHLAWSGLPNYNSLSHFEENLMPQYNFLKKIITAGLTDITVAGTCLEYGIKNGPLEVSMVADPQNSYAIAKDTLRKFLERLQEKTEFRLKWVRLFYMYGKGQSEKSILSQLDKAIEDGDEVFNMSGGEQLRDYLPVEKVSENIVRLSHCDVSNGIFNCCSGKPITVKQLVEDYLRTSGKQIRLELGHYRYNEYEAMHFWGVPNLI